MCPRTGRKLACRTPGLRRRVLTGLRLNDTSHFFVRVSGLFAFSRLSSASLNVFSEHYEFYAVSVFSRVVQRNL